MYVIIAVLFFDTRRLQMSNIAYYRISTSGQSIDAQKHELSKSFGVKFDKEFSDIGVSGSVLASQRQGFKALLDYIREGDSLFVYSLDRLGRDAIDIQSTVKALINKGVTLQISGLGVVGAGAGLIVVAVLAQIAEQERQRIKERTSAGLEAAKASLLANGVTHRGKTSLGRPYVEDPASIAGWRAANKASIATTASHFGVSTSTVARACRTKKADLNAL